MYISDTVKYVGVNDHVTDLFEGQYRIPNGMSYNSYVILDEKIAVMDSVDVHFAGVWLDNIRCALGKSTPDYLIVQHMEPDHSGSILAFMGAYPETTLVASAKAFTMMKNFFDHDFESQCLVVGENDILPLGQRTLSFFTAPMVHWPEVIVTYDDLEKTLFSADAFGKFGALDVQENWTDEARRYYIGIVGKYGFPVQSLLKKVSALDIQIICPLHGPVLSNDLGYYLGLYDTWSRYAAETDGIVIAYTSIYGNTKTAIEQLAATLKEKGCVHVVLHDLARCDLAEAVADAFRYSKLVLATTTYNGGIFPAMVQFINHLMERNFSNRTVALIENGSWSPAAAKTMKSMMETCKNLIWSETTVTIHSALNAKSSSQLAALTTELL